MAIHPTFVVQWRGVDPTTCWHDHREETDRQTAETEFHIKRLAEKKAVKWRVVRRTDATLLESE
jgi:hypothetical protein